MDNNDGDRILPLPLPFGEPLLCFLCYCYCRFFVGHVELASTRRMNKNMKKNLVTSNQNWYMGDFLESFIWSSMDHSKDNLKNNYLIFKPNYFIFKKKTIFFSYYFLNNYLTFFLTNTSIL